MDRTTAPSTTDPTVRGALPHWHPLSDHLRWIKVAALVALLVAAGVYLGWAVDDATVFVEEMFEDPQAHHGAEVYLGQFRVHAVEGDVAELWSPWVQVRVAPVPEWVATGDAVSVTGHFQRDGSVLVDRWVVHELLWVKKLVGVLATLGVFVAGGWVWWREGRRRRA